MQRQVTEGGSRIGSELRTGRAPARLPVTPYSNVSRKSGREREKAGYSGHTWQEILGERRRSAEAQHANGVLPKEYKDPGSCVAPRTTKILDPGPQSGALV